MDISIMSQSPAVINYRTPCLLLLHLSQDLLATESPQMAAAEVICSVHQHEVCCIAINQPGTRIATCFAKVRERGRAVTKVTKTYVVHSASTNWSVYVSPTTLQGTLVHVHSTQPRDLIAEFRREAQTANVYW